MKPSRKYRIGCRVFYRLPDNATLRRFLLWDAARWPDPSPARIR